MVMLLLANQDLTPVQSSYLFGFPKKCYEVARLKLT